MGSSEDLSPFQRAVLEAFFRRERGFCLTGGGALVGYHLHHRITRDLDLFTDRDDAFERGGYVLREVAAELGATVDVKVETPAFRRVLLARPDEAVVVDLVRDRVPPLRAEKDEFGVVRVDPLDEILANKLSALVGRAEERDLVDVYCLEQAGHRVEDALEGAALKDGACTPATLAWLLSEVEIPDDAVLPAGVAPGALRVWLADLVTRLRRRAFPER